MHRILEWLRNVNWGRVFKRLIISLTVAVALCGIGIEVKGLTVLADTSRVHLNITDKHGNLDWSHKTLNILKAGWDQGLDWVKGNFKQFGNHYSTGGYANNAQTAKSWLKQKGKLSKEQIHGNPSNGNTNLETEGLYGYAKQLGIDPKAYRSNKSLLKAVSGILNKRASHEDKVGSREKDGYYVGNIGKQTAGEKKAWNTLTDGLLKARKDLTPSAEKKVNAYLKKHGGEKGTTKWYKALQTALDKYATGKAKKELNKSEKTSKKQYEDSANGPKKTSADDVKKMLEKGEMPEPTTLWGKIGKALMNAFWSSTIGSWLEQNGAGATIFAGETSATQLASDVESNPYTLIYPISSDYSTMRQVSDWLQPSMIALGGALITLALVVSSMKMGWGQPFDPVRSRLAWYQNIFDTMIAVVGVAAFPDFVNMILQLDGELLMGFANFMSGIAPDGNGTSVFDTAIKLGFDKSTINAISSGMLLGGSDFSGVVFEIIYLVSYVGLAVYIKYFYFVRAITFTVLIGIGPVFVSLWSFNWGKSRTFAWLKDFLGTVFIQIIHALTITFMALFMQWNNGRLTDGAASSIAQAINWQKENPGKQFLNTITLGLANQHGNGTPSNVSVFGVLVVGFIIMILFCPLSKSLAELFGISTNMLDNINHSTSNVMKAGAALSLPLALAPARAGLSTAKNIGGALKDGVKGASKGSKNFKDFRNKLGKNVRQGFQKRKPVRSGIAKMNGIVGPSAGALIGMAAGAGAGDPQTMLALSASGGAIGERAARLVNKPLSTLGLGQLRRVGKTFTNKPNLKDTDNKVKNANKKTNGSLADQNKAVRDAENGRTAIDQNLANIEAKKQDVEQEFKEGRIPVGMMNDKLADLNKQEQHLKGLQSDQDFQDRLAVADARKQAQGSYSNATDLAKATQEALGDEADKVSVGKNGQANDIQQSLAVAGASTNGAVMSRYDGNAIEKASQQAKAKYAELNAGKFAENGFTDKQSWMDSSRYRQGEAKAMELARKDAVINSDNKVFSMPDQTDNSAFGSSMVNRDTYKNELSRRMSQAGVSKEAQTRVLNAIDGVSGQALVTETPITGSDTPLQTLNYGLNNKLAGQRAFTLNNIENPDPTAGQVSAYDLAQVYQGDNSIDAMNGNGNGTAFTADGFQSYLKNANHANRMQNIQSNLADAYADYQNTLSVTNQAFDQASANAVGFGIPNRLLGMGNLGRGDSFSGGIPGGVNPYDYVASQRIADFNSSFGPSGMNPGDAIQELRENASSASGREGSGIAPGDLRLVTGNTGSHIEAKLADGDYHLIGNYGGGDPSLSGDQQIIQNLDVGADGTIGPRYDPNTHRVETPYSLLGDVRVPRAYSNGGPNLDDMLGGYSSSGSLAKSDVTDFNTMPPSYQLARAEANGHPVTLDKLNNDYSDYRYYSDGSQAVIVGKDKDSGQFEQVTAPFQDTMLDTHMSGQQYCIPLTDTGNGLIPDSTQEPDVFSKNNVISQQARKEILDSLRLHMDNSESRLEFNNYLNDHLAPTEINPHNFIGNHSANQDFTLLDLSH